MTLLADSLVVIGLASLSLGTIQEADGPVERTFLLRNAGTEAAVLRQGYTSCGCTTIAFEQDCRIAPGDTTVVRLRFNPRGKSGEFYESGTLVYQSPSQEEQKHVTLTMEGTCLSSEESLMRQFPIRISDHLWLSADRFDLGILHTGESRERTVVLLHRDEGNRKEIRSLTLTVDARTPRGLQHIQRKVTTKTAAGRTVTIPITFDILVK